MKGKWESGLLPEAAYTHSLVLLQFDPKCAFSLLQGASTGQFCATSWPRLFQGPIITTTMSYSL